MQEALRRLHKDSGLRRRLGLAAGEVFRCSRVRLAIMDSLAALYRSVLQGAASMGDREVPRRVP